MGAQFDTGRKSCSQGWRLLEKPSTGDKDHRWRMTAAGTKDGLSTGPYISKPINLCHVIIREAIVELGISAMVRNTQSLGYYQGQSKAKRWPLQRKSFVEQFLQI
jgi:hypothetical protein